MTTGTKISKMQLKAIVKECLVEILQEGLGSLSASQYGPAINLPMSESRNPPAKKQAKISPLDMPAYPPRGAGRHTNAMMETIKNESRGNPIMAEILADTAMTTLPKMMSGGDSIAEGTSGGHSRMSQQEQFAGTPEQVFGEDVASKWANLAFSDPPSKKLM